MKKNILLLTLISVIFTCGYAQWVDGGNFTSSTSHNVRIAFPNSGAYLDFFDNGTQNRQEGKITVGSSGHMLLDANYGDLRYRTGAPGSTTLRFKIDDSGEAELIGNSPDLYLNATSTSNNSYGLKFGATVGGSTDASILYNKVGVFRSLSLRANSTTNTSTGVYINNTGALGIGTNTPDEKLEVNGAIKIGTTTSSNAGTIRFASGAFEGYDGSNWNAFDGDDWGSQVLHTTAVFDGDGTTGDILSLAQQGASVGQVLKWNGTVWVPGNDKIGIATWSKTGTIAHYNAGNVGIGTAAPPYKLHVHDGSIGVSGDSKGFFVLDTAGTLVGSMRYSAPTGEFRFFSPGVTSFASAGGVEFNTHVSVGGDLSVAGQIVHPSDKNLKENILDIDNGLSIINQLSPKTYTHKTEKASEFGLSTSQQFGLIAQEVKEVLPEIVVEKALVSEDGEIYMGLDYEKLIPILVQALKEEHAQKEALATKVNTMEAELNNVKTSVEALLSNQNLNTK